MKKVVINTCYGGFGLSHDAVLKYAEKKGKPLFWRIDDTSRKYYGDDPSNPSCIVHYRTSEDGDENETYFSERDIPRDDQALVEVVEEMGDGADGHCAALNVVEIPDDAEWEIDEYDGLEHIAETHRTWS